MGSRSAARGGNSAAKTACDGLGVGFRPRIAGGGRRLVLLQAGGAETVGVGLHRQDMRQVGAPTTFANFAFKRRAAARAGLRFEGTN